jgi:hypothetical protein
MNARNALLYVSAPVNALVEGLYRQDTTIADILARGDFGLGTFNDLDGEMVVIDSVVYQLRSDGNAYAVPDETRTPFACVTFFRPYSEEDIDQPLDYPGLLALFDRLLPSKNMLYALRLDGLFDYVRTRSVPRQDAYRPLVEVAREQPEFEFEHYRGHPGRLLDTQLHAVRRRPRLSPALPDRGQATWRPSAGMPATPHPHQPAAHRPPGTGFAPDPGLPYGGPGTGYFPGSARSRALSPPPPGKGGIQPVG